MYSLPPVPNSTQDVLPPKVPRTENGKSRSMKASIASGVRSCRSRAAISASRILPRVLLWLSGAASEPRVPQKCTGIAKGCARVVLRVATGFVLSVHASRAASTVAKCGMTSWKRLIVKIS